MCRNIKTLTNAAQPATIDEIQAYHLQAARKSSGQIKPSLFLSEYRNIMKITRYLLKVLKQPQHLKNENTKLKKKRA